MSRHNHNTLERHRSHLIPEVQYALDGTLFITDTGGTFPLRGKGAKRGDIRGHDFLSDVEPPPSFRSFDPRREEKKRLYKQRSPGKESIATGTSTISTNQSSLGRKLRRSKRKSAASDKAFVYRESSSFTTNYNTGSRLRTGPPRMSQDYADSLRRKKDLRQASLDEIIKGTGTFPMGKRISKGSDQLSQRNGLYGHSDNARLHKIHDEKLPYIVFLIIGVLLLLIGIVRILVSFWHEYYSALWTGILALILGIIGAKHKGLHLVKGISAGYIFIAFLTGLAALVASGIILRVFLPIIIMISAEKQAPSAIIKQVSFTNMGSTASTIQLDIGTMVWINVGLDISTIVFLFIEFFAMTAAMIALSNHWDACYDTTDDCDHRGNPRLFNPIEQVGLGVATAFIGLVYISAEAGFVNVTHDHFYSPVWAASMVIVSGIISFCFGKRPDQLAMGTFSCFLEVLAFLTCGAATVLTTLGLVDDVNTLRDIDNGSMKYKEFLGVAIIGGVLVVVLIINVIFVVGTIFRQFRQICCKECGNRFKKPSPDSYFSSMERGYR